MGVEKACTADLMRGSEKRSQVVWVTLVASGHRQGGEGPWDDQDLMSKVGYEHSAQNHRGVAQSDNVHSKPMNCH